MKACPECGSIEIVSELLVFSGDAQTNERPPYVKLVEPAPAKVPFIWLPKSVATGFRAAICGECGYTRFYTKHHAESSKPTEKGIPVRITRLKMFCRFDSQRVVRRRRKALPMTETELKLIAAAAITGLSSKPKNG